jgi:type IV secretion system protein VirB10
MTPPKNAGPQNAASMINARDPRQTLNRSDLEEASRVAMPAVARQASSGMDMTLVAGMVGALALGGIAFVVMSNQRQAAPAAVTPQTPVPVPLPPPPMPQYMPPADPPAPVFVAPIQPPPPVPVASPEGSRAPALVIDNSDVAGSPAAAVDPAKAGTTGGSLLNNDEQFAARFNKDGATKATRLASPSMTVPQGAIVPAVLETALNSDLPGYVRALVSRDVKSFDGTRVLIPRGSRLIGQYKSGLSSGVTRAFVIWSRIIRPDGVSVQLASPATDELGQSGLGGKVDNHFAKRFGAAMLLSVVSGLASSSSGSSNTIVIGTTSQAQSVANDALSADMKISPTIKVAQGTAIQVFVAADLDFSQ